MTPDVARASTRASAIDAIDGQPRRWRRLLAPWSRCEVCERWQADTLCAPCRTRFAAPRSRCVTCGLPLPSADPETATGAAPRCGRCLNDPPPFERTVVALDYAFPWPALIGRFKFQGAVELARPFGDLLAAAASRAFDDGRLSRPTLLLPVPLSPTRLAERGFNQAHELARHVGRRLGVPMRADVLTRPLDTAHQAGLGRDERQRNLRGAFLVPPAVRARVASQRVALVDDVMTTGATAREAAAALQRAGAAAVDLWMLARTPEPGRD